MADGIDKLIAFFPSGGVDEFDGADVFAFGHNPETGAHLFAIQAREPERVEMGSAGVAGTPGEPIPNTIDTYHGIPFMIRQKKNTGPRIAKPDMRAPTILKP